MKSNTQHRHESNLRSLWVCLFFFAFAGVKAQNYFTFSGTVTDSAGHPIQGVQVGVRLEEDYTRTNIQGNFKLRLQEGLYTIIFSYLGYEKQSVNIALHSDVKRSVVLYPDLHELSGVNIKAGKRDRGLEIMKLAIARREHWLKHIQTLECRAYIRASDETETKKKKFKTELDSLEFMLSDTLPKTPDVNLAEFSYTRFWQYPNKIKEIKEAGKIVGNKYDLFYLSSTEANFNFYQTTIQNRGLSDHTFLSPLSPLAPLSYKYDLKGYSLENGQGIYKIRITPKAFGNALFSGDVYIYENSWNLYKVDLHIEGAMLNKYTGLQIIQQYAQIQDSFYVPLKQEFIYTRKASKKKTIGRTICLYSQVKINPTFPPKLFGDELMTSKEDAYEKTGSFWDSIRPEPLNISEIKAIQFADSIKMAHERKEYIDSVDSITNRVTWSNLLWWGQQRVNRQKQEYYSFPSFTELFLNSFLNGMVLGGPRVRGNISYYKKFNSRRTISTNPDLSYGFRNRDVKGTFGFDWVYAPISRGELSVEVGKQFDLIFPYDAYLNVFKSSNFYEHSFVNIDHSVELVNGLYISGYMQYAHRESVTKYGFQNFFDTAYGVRGKPLDFDAFNALTGEVRLRYTPHQLYLREPREKIILGSRWPMFQIRYRKGIPGVGGSIVNFDYTEFQIRQKISMKLLGNAEYNIKTGRFWNTSQVFLMDYKYHRRGDPFLFTNPLQTYQLLDSSFPTFKWFLEGHYFHRFNGYFTNRIPGLEKLHLNEVAGSAFLYAPEVGKTHAEVFFGLERAFKVLGRSFRLGVYSAYGVTNGQFMARGFKFSIEYFDPVRNRWQF